MNLVEQEWRRAKPIADRRQIYEWAAENVDFGNQESFKGHYNVENVPWTRAPLEALNNPFVREVTCVMPPQVSGKTKMAEVFLAHRIMTKPGKIAFNTLTNTGAAKWADTRWKQMLMCVKGMDQRFSDDRHDKQKRRIIFKDGSFLLIQGAELPANRQSDSVEIQVNDEVHFWEKPWHQQMKNRTLAYRDTKKILNISIGGEEGSELEERFNAGNQGEWSHHCPKCTQLFQYVFDHRKPNCNIRFNMTKAIVRSDDSLDLTEFAKTVRVHCQHCKHEMEYDEERLAEMNLHGEYVYARPSENPDTVSFHVNMFAIGRQSWTELLTPWVRLNLRGGVFTQGVLRQFITETLAEFWIDKPMVVSKEIRLGSYTRSEMLAPGGWKDEWIRVMAVDNQHGSQGDIPHRWFVCRAFARSGKSRLVDCGRINEWSGVQERARFLGIPEWSAERPGPWVVVDRRHKPEEVDEVCAGFKWHGMMGSDNEEFLHGQHSPHAGLRMAFSEERYSDIGYGTGAQGRKFAIYFLWCSQKVQGMLAQLRDGKAEQWEVPSDIMSFCPEYAEHINSHRQVMELTKTGQERPTWKKIGGWRDDMYDCESELVTVGLMAGVFKRE